MSFEVLNKHNKVKKIIIGNELLWQVTELDYNETSVLFCAKDPFHKLVVGYTTKSLEKTHPKYLFAYKGDNILALNMVDAPQKVYFNDKMVDEGLNFIERQLDNDKNVMVVCNRGESRSATMVLMYLMKKGKYDFKLSAEEVFDRFLFEYPYWKPNRGILEYCIDFWNDLKESD